MSTPVAVRLPDDLVRFVDDTAWESTLRGVPRPVFQQVAAESAWVCFDFGAVADLGYPLRGGFA